MVVWIEVTNDKYELPVTIADSAAELARKTGHSKGSVESCASKYKNGHISQSRFQRIEIPEEDEVWT